MTLWHEMRLLPTVLENKLLFIETPDPVESTLALNNYRCVHGGVRSGGGWV